MKLELWRYVLFNSMEMVGNSQTIDQKVFLNETLKENTLFRNETVRSLAVFRQCEPLVVEAFR
ncbi:MAG: hypothetical protein JW730_05140 [Anaerolineales bacterium]|nr:hypothetical protein [Anaerolineales bacterium]